MSKIEHVYAFVTDTKPGEEGVVGLRLNDVWVPMLAGSKDDMEALLSNGLLIANTLKLPVRVLEFGSPKEITTLWPAGPATPSEGPESQPGGH